jgi:hypothetical protein
MVLKLTEMNVFSNDFWLIQPLVVFSFPQVDFTESK